MSRGTRRTLVKDIKIGGKIAVRKGKVEEIGNGIVKRDILT
jgi:hypothetical protein